MYLARSCDLDPGFRAPDETPRVPNKPPMELSTLERTVIALAAADARRGVAYVAEDDRSFVATVRRLHHLALGRRGSQPLANPRLEALRRFAHAAARGRDCLDDIRALRGAGFSVAQIVLAASLSQHPQTEPAPLAAHVEALSARRRRTAATR